jgi:hypothetical protein
MSLLDLVFDGMFPGDGGMLDGDATPPGTRVCSWCRKECEDEDEDLCRACFAAGDSGVVESTGEQLVAAARALGTICTAAAVPVPMQTAAGTLSAHIPVVDASPMPTGPLHTTAPPSGGRKALSETQAARKKATDRQCQQRRVGRMKALQTENATQAATIKKQEHTIRSLKASLQRKVGGSSNANATTRGGLHEHLLISHYEHWQEVKFALDHSYCNEDNTPLLARRSFFQDEAGQVRVVGRFMWNPVGNEPFGGLAPLQEYAGHLAEAGNGRLVFRSEGAYGKGMQILDSGDCMSTEIVGECERTYLHRDWDNNRLNSLTIILALGNDVMGYAIRNDKGGIEEMIVRMQPGEMHIFPTSVYHFGASHEDYNNTIVGRQGRTESSLRRRVFCYMDWDTAVKDEEGYVDSAKTCPVPDDYNLKIVRDIPNASVAFTYLSSPMLEGRTMQFENNKLVGNAVAQSPLGKRTRR